MDHKLIIRDESTGESHCSCGMWGYEVRSFRPAWPMDKEVVREQVDGAFAAHLKKFSTEAAA